MVQDICLLLITYIYEEMSSEHRQICEASRKNVEWPDTSADLQNLENPARSNWRAAIR